MKGKHEHGYNVSWSSHKDNSPVPAYKDIVKFFNGTWRQNKDDVQVLDFRVPRQADNATLQMAPSEDSSPSKSFSPSGLQGSFHVPTMVSHRSELSWVVGQNERTKTTGNAELTAGI